MKSNLTKWIVAVIVIVIIIILGVTSSRNAGNKVIKIGVIAPLTGIVADYGDQMRRGIESASTTGFQFIFEDDKCEAKEAVSAFKKLTDFEKVNYIIGPGCGSPQEAIAPLLKGGNRIDIVPSAASQNLFALSGGNVFNMQYSLEKEASFVADQLYARGYKRVTLVSYQNAFSKAMSDSFKTTYKGTVVHDIVYASNSADVSSELVKIKKVDYDAIFVIDISFYFGQGLAKLHNLGINVPIYSPYAVELPVVRPLVEDVFYSFPANITDGKGGVNGIARDSAQLLISALGACGDKPACVKDFISKTGFDQYGTNQRSIILKQIKGGLPVIVNANIVQ